MIVKLQRPLFSTVPNPPVLAYDKHKKFQANLPMTEELDTLFGVRLKIYCEARLDGDNKLVIGKKVPDPSW